MLGPNEKCPGIMVLTIRDIFNKIFQVKLI